MLPDAVAQCQPYGGYIFLSNKIVLVFPGGHVRRASTIVTAYSNRIGNTCFDI